MTPQARSRPAAWHQTPVLGVDLGGVVIRTATTTEDTGFLDDDWIDTPEVDGCIAALARLHDGPFNAGIQLISKAGPRIQQRSRDWLAHRDFFNRSGIPPANLVFVRERRDKAEVCRKRRVTHFIDDHISVLNHLDTVAHRYLFTGGGTSHEATHQVPSGIAIAATWPEAEAMLLESLR